MGVFGCEIKYAVAQESIARDSIKIFVDCEDCDLDYLRQNVTFLNYVHDRTDADVHVLVTIQNAGGGKEYQLRFIGLSSYKGQDNLIVFVSSSTDTSEELRQKLMRNFVFGSLVYIAETKIAEHIKVTHELDKTNSANTKDPWNYWVFSVTTDGAMFVEEKRSSNYYNGSISAGRVTENWKIDIGTSGSYNKNRYILPDGSLVLSSQQSYSVNSFIIKSLNQYWGVGSGITLERNSFYNLRPSFKFVLATEYNLFPYNQSSNRIFTLNYQIGLADLSYKERTIFGKIDQTLLTQEVGMNFTTKRSWGGINLGTQFSQLGNSGIFRGLSLNFRGRIRLISDQIYLSGNGITSEEALLQQRAQATGFDKYVGIGFTFRFGSIYNSIVNSRLNNVFSDIF